MLNVVVFESDKWLADILVEEFTKAGYRPTWFEYPPVNVTDAVTAVGPALITMDIVMRDMDGFQATYLIKQDPRIKDVPLVFYSNLSTKENIERGSALGAKHYFVKSRTSPPDLVRESLAFVR